MCGKWCTLLLHICLVAGEYYTAGVVEFRPDIAGATSAQLLEDNLSAYLELISLANGTTDIIVFPEATLNSLLQLTAVPQPNATHSLCHPTTGQASAAGEFMQQLACAAVQANTYLLFNVKEREDCDNRSDLDCPTRGYRVYNTNVAIDRSGAIVSRYRKWNLYLEPQLNRTATPEFGIFETDFNVTFGHFVCFDMLFYTPAQELVERFNIRNVIVTKMFNSELPFLTASQLQQGWAWANNVNLLAAGASLPHGGISGSGIYAGRGGALARRMVGNATEGVRQLLLARVPHSPDDSLDDVTFDEERTGPEQLQLLMLQQPQLDEFNSWQVQLGDEQQQQQQQQRRLCHTDLCCDFEWSLESEAPQTTHDYVYRVGVFVGRRRYEEAQYSVVRLCGLFACRNASVESCGQLREATAAENGELQLPRFNTLRVSGEFVERSRRQLMPSTLSVSLYALQATELLWSVADATRVQLQLHKPHSHLLTFGIYGNYFEDEEDEEEDEEEEEEEKEVPSHNCGTALATSATVVMAGLLLQQQ